MVDAGGTPDCGGAGAHAGTVLDRIGGVIMEQMVTLTFEEQAKQYPAGTTLYEIAQEYQPRYTDDIILA